MLQSFQFNEHVIAVCGNNGAGKTNLLDAIYFLCFTKSYFAKTDNAVVHKNLQGMRLEGKFLRSDEEEKIVCIIRENGKKEMRRNGEDYKRFSEHIGQFPAVIIAPDDVDLITGSGEVRRKYVDTLISQLDRQYLLRLIEYTKVLQQRNSLLKAIAERRYTDYSLLDVITAQLVEPARYIYTYRKNFLANYLPAVAEGYHKIAGSNEQIALEYYSPLFEDDIEKLLGIYRDKDIMLQRTTVGIHKDDIDLKLNGESFKNIASQGQRKSLLFALKLEEFETLKSAKGFSPIILLDDVFEKLDESRIEKLLQHVCLETDSHVFITDTHKERLQQALQKLKTSFQLIEL